MTPTGTPTNTRRSRGPIGQRWTNRVNDEAVAAKIRGVADKLGSVMELARKASLRRQSLDDVVAGKKLLPRTWVKIAEKVAAVDRVEDQEGWQAILDQLRSKASRPASGASKLVRGSGSYSRAPTCASCEKRRVRVAGEKHCSRCRVRSDRGRFTRCVHCGMDHAFGDTLSSSISSTLCCIFTPKKGERKRGECAWCGDDLSAKVGDEADLKERDFCDKRCSIAYAADVTRGTFGEGMVDAAAASSFSSSSWDWR